MMRRLLLILFGTLLFSVLLGIGIFIPPLQIGYYLLVGWFSFLKRTTPQVTIDWSGVALASICGLLIVIGVHRFCSWIFRHAKGNEHADAARWPWRWTSGICLSIVLLFMTSISITGICHQVGWWISSKEPLYSKSRFERVMIISSLKEQSVTILLAAENHDWDFFATARALATEKDLLRARNSIETWHRILVPAKDGKLAAAFVFHRNPQSRARAGFVLIQPESTDLQPLPESKLHEEMSRFGLTANAFFTATNLSY